MPLAAARVRRAAPKRPTGRGGAAVALATASRAHPGARGTARIPAGPPIKLTNPKAAKDPRFLKVMGKLQQSAMAAKQHPPAAQKAAQAQAAARPPANEKLGGAKANQVDAMKETEGKKPESSSFLDMLRAEIQKVMPKKTEDAKDFMKGDDKQQLTNAMGNNVGQQKEDASGPLKATSQAAPDPSQVQGKEVAPLPAEPAPAPPPTRGRGGGYAGPQASRRGFPPEGQG